VLGRCADLAGQVTTSLEDAVTASPGRSAAIRPTASLGEQALLVTSNGT
jgi:hypothetical protein